MGRMPQDHMIQFPKWTLFHISLYMLLVLFFWRLLIQGLNGSVSRQFTDMIKAKGKM